MTMTTPRALTFVAAVGLAFAGSASAASSDASRTVLLSSASLLHLRLATLSLLDLAERSPSSLADIPVIPRTSLELTAATRTLEERPAARAALDGAGLKPGEYVLAVAAFSDAIEARELTSKAGQPPPVGLLAANVRVLERNPSDVRDILRNLRRLSLAQDKRGN
jgi:hypothetical protein